MITVKIKFGEHTTDIDFPCKESELHKKLESIDAVEDFNPKIFVTTVVDPEELKVFENSFIDLDELNYLSKRMDSLDSGELARFYAAADYENLSTPKDLINLSFNLERYTLIQNLTNMEEVGKTHMMCKSGGISEEMLQKINFAEIGRSLIASGKGVLGEHGVMFKNEDVPYHEEYDGTVFPRFDYYGNCFISASLEYNGKKEYLFFPDDDIAISKALVRMGYPNLDDCKITLDESGTFKANEQEWFGYLETVLESEDLYAVNRLSDALQYESDLEKLSAVMEYADVSSADNIARLSNKLDYFIYEKNVNCDEDVGRNYIDERADYKLHPELEEFFDYERFGEYIRGEHDGKFIGSGYVSMDDGYTLDSVLPNNHSMEFGGM